MKKTLSPKRIFNTAVEILLDAVIFFISMSLARWITSNFSTSLKDIMFEPSLSRYSLLFAVSSLAIFYLFGIYKMLCRFIGFRELCIIIIAVSVGNLVPIVVKFLSPGFDMGFVQWLLNFGIQLVLIIAIRVAYRMYLYLFGNKLSSKSKMKNGKRTMIIGAGECGRVLIAEIHHGNRIASKPCCIIDDNTTIVGGSIDGVPIVGTRDNIIEAAEKYHIEQIVFAIPSASAEQKKQILEICQKTGCTLKAIPGIYQMMAREKTDGIQMRDVQVEDLLGREPVEIDMQAVRDELSGKVILVTGGGGSIGSELCRQIASYGPKKLIILDVYENNAYDIQQELKKTHPELDFDTVIASVRETDRIDKVFELYHPNIVFHAAAHKHVPLMEDSPNEAIKNNVFGTYKTALAAIKHGTEKFVLISTDKAVNPTNIMGASKRLCEMVVQALNSFDKTDFVAVRFGNVLGSNGSVIPLFKRQIAEGGPVTITHPDIIRYFMTIPEAVSLVLEAGAEAKGGEIFVLDMGAPVKIDDLARNLIRLSGLEPDIDIKIEYTGLRPGEKLYEEMLMSEEGLRRTDNKLIYIGNPIDLDNEKFFSELEQLRKQCTQNSPDIKSIVSKMVPTYKYEQNQ